MRRFHMQRLVDVSGVSGTGIVAEGVEWHNGKATLCWRTDVSSITVFDSMERLERIHGHNGGTQIVWID